MNTKTTAFNLIILDESGSMSPVTNQTISGCNEILNTIRRKTAENADTLHSLVSIYAFQSDGDRPSRYLIKNANPAGVADITVKDYHPYGCTPLLDAVGSTLSELKTVSQTHEDATGIITIITDGYENASRRYSWPQVSRLIGWFREKGWTVNLIGADIDLDKMSSSLGIDRLNARGYTRDEEGTREMFADLPTRMPSV